MRYLIISAVATLGLLWGGCGEKPQTGGGGFSMPPTLVETAIVAPQSVVDRFTAVGSIQAGERVTVAAEINGVVVRIPFREGDAITRGALIAQLDDAQSAAEVKRAEAVLAQRRTTYERVKDVVDQGAGAPQDLDDAAAALQVAEAEVELVRARFKKTRITAPFDGIVGTRRVSAGAFLQPGQGITELAQIATLRVYFSVPERYLGQLQRGSEVKVSTTAYPGYALRGRIDVVEPVLDVETRSVRVMAQLDNPGLKFRPGMSADVAAVLRRRDNALTVPSEAVFASGSDAFVFVVKADSSVTRQALELGTRLPDAVEVIAGLEANAVVVKAGHQKLFEGAKVIPTQTRETP